MYDAIIVLANLMDADGSLNDETIGRLSKAAELWNANLAPFIVTCGWAYREDSEICIADAMADHAKNSLGIPSTNILTETNSRDTVGDAIFTQRNLASPRNWLNIVVVTTGYHADRTRKIFSFVYGKDIDVVTATGAQSPALSETEHRSLEAFKKTFVGVGPGDDEEIFSRLVQDHPFYNGRVYPRIA